MLETLLERVPDYREARLTLAKAYVASNRPADALAILQSTTPQDVVARSLIGAAYLLQGNLGDAATHLEYAIKNDRSLIDARINLAQIYSRRGDKAKAERFRRSAAHALEQIHAGGRP
jgi:Tfp pilus assembly protein PilF